MLIWLEKLRAEEICEKLKSHPPMKKEKSCSFHIWKKSCQIYFRKKSEGEKVMRKREKMVLYYSNLRF